MRTAAERSNEARFKPGDVADWFNVSDRTARQWLGEWRDQGYVEPASDGERIRLWRHHRAVGDAARTLLAELIAESE